MENPPSRTGSKTQGLNEQAKDSIPQAQSELAEDGKLQDLNEQAKDSIPQAQNGLAEDGKLQDLNEQAEDSKPQDLNEQVEAYKPQDLKDWVESQLALETVPAEILDQVPEVEEVFISPRISGSRPQKMTMTNQKEEEKPSSLLPEPILDDSTLLKPAEDSELQDLKEMLEERRKSLMETPEALEERRKTLMETPEALEERRKSLMEALEERRKSLMEIPEQRTQEDKREGKFFQYSYTVSRRTSKKLKAEAPAIPSKPPPLLSQSVPPRMRYIAPKPKPQTADKATQLRAIPIFPLRLPGVVKTHQRSPDPKPQLKPATYESGTQISPSFERLMKRPPPPLFKRKKSKDKTISKSSSVSSSSLSKESRKGYRNIDQTLQRKCRTTERAPRSSKKGTAIERASRSPKKHTAVERASRSQSKLGAVECASWSQTKHGRPQVIYNFYVNLCDRCREMEPCDYPPCNWKECASYAGLSRACTVFSTLKSGGIQVSDLLMTLHALGILVTCSEMQQTLKCVNVYGGFVNFTEFLEAVNQTSPFAETDALQNALRAFRKIKKGMVDFRDLESVLANLGVELSYRDIRRILKCSGVSNCDKVDLSNFFEVAREMESPIEEEVCPSECTVWQRKPFQDVSNLVSAKARWRRKYASFDEEICGPWSYSCDDIAIDRQQGRVSWIPVTVCSAEEEYKDSDIMIKSQPGSPDQRKSITGSIQDKAKIPDTIEMKKSQADVADQGKSNTASIHNVEAENKEGGVLEMIKSPADGADQGSANSTSAHNLEAEKKKADIVEVTAS